MNCAAACLLAVLLAGCVATPNSSAVITGKAAADAASLGVWTARGRLGISSPAQSGSGSFAWQQQHTNSQASLRGPAGMGGLTMTLQGAALTLATSDGASFDAQAAQAELETRLGVMLPLNYLPQWLRGLPDNHVEHHWLDDATLMQAGWQIHYSEWTQRATLRLPIKLQLQQGEVRVTVKIQEWRIDD